MSEAIKKDDNVKIMVTSWRGTIGKVLLTAERLPVKRPARKHHTRGQQGETKPGVLVEFWKGRMRRQLWFHLDQVELAVPEAPVVSELP